MHNICIIYGENSLRYSFPQGHPFGRGRSESFIELFRQDTLASSRRIKIVEPILASEDTLLAFHTREYVDFVKKASALGYGTLDQGDTPAFKGIFEAASYVVGSTLLALDLIVRGVVDHGFVPVGGLHHARRGMAGGFCVFNDAALAISVARKKYGLKRILYVDIDAHHGDGVFYEYYDDPEVFIVDIHEDGKFLYPGTGRADETGSNKAEGTKLNIPLKPGAGDEEFGDALRGAEQFIRDSRPHLILFQCGSDGLKNDPITHLGYTPEAHRFAAKLLHKLSHESCNGRIIGMGGGGYNPDNTAKAWMAVVSTLCEEV